MTATRLQGDRHWAQVETPSTGDDTACRHLDLNMVDCIAAVWRSDYSRDNYAQSLKQVSITYAGVMQPIVLQGKHAIQFWETWSAFIHLQEVAPVIMPGVIHLATSKGDVLKPM